MIRPTNSLLLPCHNDLFCTFNLDLLFCPALLPGSYLCDPSCLTCAGSGADQCLSCSVSGTSVIYSGQNSFGPCLAPCGAGQYRDPISLICQSPDCSLLSNCNGEGSCVWNGTQSVCSCYFNFQGSDCSIPLNCPALSNCSGQGTCGLDQTTQKLNCQCTVGWQGPTCANQSTYAFSPTRDTELGGTWIKVTSSAEFTSSENVTCTFGPTTVTAMIQAPNAYCQTPPYHTYSVNVNFAVTVGCLFHWVNLLTSRQTTSN